jgi:hypothetical protein
MNSSGCELDDVFYRLQQQQKATPEPDLPDKRRTQRSSSFSIALLLPNAQSNIMFIFHNMVMEAGPSLFVDHLLLLAFIDPTVDWFEFGKLYCCLCSSSKSVD